MGTTFKEAKIGQIPTDWKLVKFEDIGVTYGGLTNKNKGDFGKGKPYIPFLNIMNNAKIDLDYFDYVDVQEGEKQNRAKKGDLFFNTSSETPEEVGMCSVLCDDVPELYLNSFCFGFRIEDQNSILPLFVSYFFRSGVGRKVIFPLAQGMTRYNLSKRYFLQLEIPKPKTEEQRKIAEILSTVDEAIEKTDAIIQETLQLKKGLMRKLFTEGIGHTKFKETTIGRIPEEWECLGVERVIQKSRNSIKAGPFGSALTKSTYVESGYKIYGQEQVIPNDFTVGDYYISSEKFEELKAFEVKPNDLLISLVGTFGKVSVVPEGIERGIINPRLIKITPDSEKVAPQFLAFLLSSSIVQEQMQRYTHGATMGILNTKTINSLRLPIPPISEQRHIVRVFSEVDERIETEQAFKAELEQLKKGLMQVLLTGKIRVKV